MWTLTLPTLRPRFSGRSLRFESMLCCSEVFAVADLFFGVEFGKAHDFFEGGVAVFNVLPTALLE